MRSRALLLGLLLAVLLGGLASCSRSEPALSTGRVIPAAELPGVRGDVAYAEVNSAALPALQATYADTLSHLGLRGWDGRFDCNHLVDLWISAAQVRYAAATWHSSTPAQTLALASVWYLPDGPGRPGHALIQARTERGMVYFEPQGGREVFLTPAQAASIYFRRW